MFKRFLPFLALVSLVEAYGEVRHVELNGAHLIDTSNNNYALAAPSLLQNQWKTVSVNGNNVVIMSPSCQTITKTLNSLNAQERQAIEAAKNQLYNVDSNSQQQISPINGQVKYGSSRYSLDAGNSRMQISRSVNVNFNSYSYNGMSISKSDDNNYSAAKVGMPNNLARIFVNNDIATYVYLDGQVQMKPRACLQPAEIQLNEQIKQEALLAEQKLKQDMQNLQNNMQNMQQNLQQNMQNMQQNMQNMFGNGFPFNRMQNGNMMMNGNNMMLQQQGYPNQFQQQYSNGMGMSNGFGNLLSSNSMFPGYQSMQSNLQPFGNNFPFGGAFGTNFG